MAVSAQDWGVTWGIESRRLLKRGRMDRKARLDRNERCFARKNGENGEISALRSFQCGCLVVYMFCWWESSGEGFGDPHSLLAVNFEAASFWSSDFPFQGGLFAGSGFSQLKRNDKAQFGVLGGLRGQACMEKGANFCRSS